MNVPFQLPEKHPIAALAASRMFYWIEQQDAAQAAAFARGAFHSSAEGIDCAFTTSKMKKLYLSTSVSSYSRHSKLA
jgi:hypothetical protein